MHLEPTPTGNGYWVLDETGRVRTYGDVRFFGSLGDRPPATPVISVALRT